MSNSEEKDYEQEFPNGQNQEDINEDWGSDFDNLDSGYWEHYYGGPDELQDRNSDDDFFYASWRDFSKGQKPSDSNISHFYETGFRLYLLKCNECEHSKKVNNYLLQEFSLSITLTKYPNIKSLLRENLYRFRCSKCGKKRVKVFEEVAGQHVQIDLSK